MTTRKRSALLAMTVALAATVASVPAGAAVIDEVAAHDTSLWSGGSQNIHGSLDRMFLGYGSASASDIYFDALSWSLGSVPMGEFAVTDGTVTLHVLSHGGGFEGQIIDMYAIASANAGWLESDFQDYASWNGKSTFDSTQINTAWTGGAGLGGFDESAGGYGPTPLDSFTWGSVGVEGPNVITLTIPQSVLNDWITNPAGNAGILLRRRNETAATSFLRIHSEETTTEGLEPTLTFVTAVPEPASAVLIVLGGVTVLRRGRASKR